MNTLQYILEALQALVSYLKKANSTGSLILPEKLKKSTFVKQLSYLFSKS